MKKIISCSESGVFNTSVLIQWCLVGLITLADETMAYVEQSIAA